MIFKSDNERHSYGPDKLIPPARQPASPPARQPASPPASQPARPPAFANLITSFFLRKTWLKIDLCYKLMNMANVIGSNDNATWTGSKIDVSITRYFQ
ncbi:hypothetical protein DPMN_051559 [Dreissena polymorpha]|uniref:Uncharacterized protein n=1 Tax=Dreissena polymorpha TaxID=45954 RepID=A0A9D4HP32_DREPO|nr:hypothetical protein DPMN_051559 [Dreissena polymorpha]